MAKKKFNISSTLSKNKKKEVTLAKKVPLKKTTKDPEVIKSKVEKIHAGEAVNETPQKVEIQTPIYIEDSPIPIIKEKATPKLTKAKPKEAKPRMVRMTIDTPEDMHLRLKIKSIQARTSMREYVLKLIEKDLKKG